MTVNMSQFENWTDVITNMSWSLEFDVVLADVK